MFDSREYEWADISLLLGGRDMVEIRAIKYGEKAEREPLFAKGRTARSIQTGNISVEGEITVTMAGYNALVMAAGGSILSLSVDGICSYGNPLEGNVPQTDRILGIRFTEGKKEAKQGDKFMEVTLPFLALNVVPLQNSL